MKKFRYILFLLFTIQVFVTNAQGPKQVIDRMMLNIRTGNYEHVSTRVLYGASVGDVETVVLPYLNDSLPSIRIKGYALVGDLGYRKQELVQRQAAVEVLVSGLSDKNSGVVGEVCNWLEMYHKQDYSSKAMADIGRVIQKRPRHLGRVAKIMGFVQNEDQKEILRMVLMGGLSRSDAFAVRQALARMGDSDQLAFFTRRLENLEANDAILYRLGPVLAYIRQTSTLDYLISVLLSDKRNCNSPNPDYDGKILCSYKAMELLAPVMEDFPIAVDEDGFIETSDYEQALEAVRTWVLAQGSSYRIRSDRY